MGWKTYHCHIMIYKMGEKRQTAWDGSIWYTNPFLRIYDWFALGFTCRFIWGCKSENILELYNKHVSGNHLDIGCGTGFFLDKCRFPTENPVITLVDLNPYALEIAKKRLARYRPRIHAGDILQPLEIGNNGFDSIGLTHLLHCLPGDMKSKGIVFTNLKALLSPSGVIYGSTFLANGTRYHRLTRIMFWLTNRIGFMTNKNDDVAGLSELLKQHFAEYDIKIIGCEAVFWARNKRT